MGITLSCVVCRQRFSARLINHSRCPRCLASSPPPAAPISTPLERAFIHTTHPAWTGRVVPQPDGSWLVDGTASVAMAQIPIEGWYPRTTTRPRCQCGQPQPCSHARLVEQYITDQRADTRLDLADALVGFRAAAEGD